MSFFGLSCDILFLKSVFFHIGFSCIQNWIVSKWIFQKKNEAMSKGYVWDEPLTICLKTLFFLHWIFLYSKLDCFKMDFQKN